MSRARTGSRPSGNPRRTRGPGHAGSSDLRARRSGDGETGSRTSVSTRRQEVRRRRSSPHCRTGIETEPATEDGTLRSGVRRARDDRQAVRIAEGRNAAGHLILVSCRRAGAHAKERTERQFPADEYGKFPARLPEGTPGCRPPPTSASARIDPVLPEESRGKENPATSGHRIGSPRWLARYAGRLPRWRLDRLARENREKVQAIPGPTHSGAEDAPSGSSCSVPSSRTLASSMKPIGRSGNPRPPARGRRPHHPPQGHRTPGRHPRLRLLAEHGGGKASPLNPVHEPQMHLRLAIRRYARRKRCCCRSAGHRNTPRGRNAHESGCEADTVRFPVANLATGNVH